jgi:glycosyltransferase involved in cell wall biosynthesis
VAARPAEPSRVAGLSKSERTIEPPLARLLAPTDIVDQPPLLEGPPAELNAVVGTLALGGAERIVLQWAERTAAHHRVRLVVLRDAADEWPVPAGVEVVRLHGVALDERLAALGAAMAASRGTVLCHLLTAAERDALARGGARPIPVLHNAEPGWLESTAALVDTPWVITVSEAAAADVRASGAPVACTVVRHLPAAPTARPGARVFWRARWALPADALVIGMMGGVKPQKAYPRALRILAAVLARGPAYLVIVGGPVGRDGALAWRAVLAQAQRLGLEPFVRLPGFVRDAAGCLPAFDVVLNTSHYEGLSVATLEALAAEKPVVASRVGGQGEVAAPGLTLLPVDAPDAAWVDAITAALVQRPARPDWVGFPSHRLWTLCQLATPPARGRGVLFITANLNAGGAQRSLTNLALALAGRVAAAGGVSLEIAVTGRSSSAAFADALREAGVAVYRTSDSRDCFDHAEVLVRRVAASSIGVVCFWNVDAKVKLLLVKTLGWTAVKFVDVSPGDFAFEEMDATADFQRCIAFSALQYAARLDRLVLKYHAPARRGPRTVVISNGVPDARRPKTRFGASPPRLVVSGRIAPTKFLLEIVAAWRLVRAAMPGVELHLLGPIETRHRDYGERVLAAIGDDLDRGVFVQGGAPDAPQRVARYDVAIVLGESQGCPNAVLEALAAGVPVVANDSGGTRELIVDERTGLLLGDRAPTTIAGAVLRLLRDPELARALAEAGRAHVARGFSMTAMAHAYQTLFSEVTGPC